ncbi:sensor histidine kinase [Mongoliibacter ruber]|uniref:Histidine kinase n=1 Tax=Mongoliibacter ruber TaxID=1750599 RepID=A0A2T0WS68_9BACT|nr:histidine kinase [Mongoliibacter ruber]PRY89548.1 histidine kinase [Mongoliibacter ruber]
MRDQAQIYPKSWSKKVFVSATIFNSLGRFILLNLLIAAVLMLIQCPACLLSFEGLKSIFPEFLFSFLMSSTISFGGFTVENYFDKRISWIQQPVKRLVFTTGTYLLYCFVVSYILITLYVVITVEEVTFSNISWLRILTNTLYPIIIAVIIIAIFISRSWLFEWRNAAIEAEKLRSEKLASQYQSLKNQLNPHFLFNSLNVLSNLVYESPDKSADFIQQLSRIYRYVLEVQNEELVSLEEELVFAENYLSLQKIRFESSLEYFVEVTDVSGYFIPPLSLQLLLENAIKHNVASRQNPLKVFIHQNGQSLEVRNILQPKSSQEEEVSGIGLENIKKRYELLSDRQLEIRKTKHEFIVSLPLLRVDNREFKDEGKKHTME